MTTIVEITTVLISETSTFPLVSIGHQSLNRYNIIRVSSISTSGVTKNQPITLAESTADKKGWVKG